MRLKDISIYQLASLSLHFNELFEKDEFLRNFYKDSHENITEEVLNPELSENGLRHRQENITTVTGALGIYAFILMIGSIALGFVLFDEPSPIIIYFSIIPYCMFGTSIHIGLFRANRAFLDEKRFKREGYPKDFKINTKAHIRWYDFFMGIPFGLFLFFL